MWGLAVKFVPVTIVFLSVQAAVLVGAWLAHPGESPDPFAPYEAMMPGQSTVVLRNHPCESKIRSAYNEMLYCETFPTNSPFASVSASIQDGRYILTEFDATNLSVGDIVRRWGRPDRVWRSNQYAFHLIWSDQGLFGIIDPVGSIERFSYMSRVERFILGIQPSISN
jgi:hypothetical protein